MPWEGTRTRRTIAAVVGLLAIGFADKALWFNHAKTVELARLHAALETANAHTAEFEQAAQREAAALANLERKLAELERANTTEAAFAKTGE